MTTSTIQNFQGVVCCCFDTNRTVSDTIYKFFDLKQSSCHPSFNCRDLNLKNKYYEATIQLIDFERLKSSGKAMIDVLPSCQAIILYGDGSTLTIEQLDSKLLELDKVQGEPRILLCDNIGEDLEVFKGLRDWSIQNGFDLILTHDDDIQNQLIDSLSAYKWVHRTSHDTITTSAKKEELNDDLLKKIMDFDSLLNKMSTYRNRPELRGDPNDKDIEEIAEILSGLIGDDMDNFLDDDDD